MRVLLYPLFRLNVDYLRSGNYKYLIKYMVVTCTKGNMTPTELDLMTPIKSSVAHSYSLSLFIILIFFTIVLTHARGVSKLFTFFNCSLK